jgi:hypothetical protein
MAANINGGAAAPGPVTPESDEGPTVAAVAPQENKRFESPDSRAAPLAEQVLRVIEGESKAAQYLARLQAQQADPDELAVILSMLYGATLRGFCRALEKAIGVRHE